MSDTDHPTYTVSEFCQLERISRSKLYQLWTANRGPRYFLIGPHSRRITQEARRAWHHELEAEATASANTTKPRSKADPRQIDLEEAIAAKAEAAVATDIGTSATGTGAATDTNGDER